MKEIRGRSDSKERTIWTDSAEPRLGSTVDDASASRFRPGKIRTVVTLVALGIVVWIAFLTQLIVLDAPAADPTVHDVNHAASLALRAILLSVVVSWATLLPLPLRVKRQALIGCLVAQAATAVAFTIGVCQA